MQFSTPNPKVHHIPTIFRMINEGKIKIPAFQRGLVWREKDALDLFESIYKGYPIGNILFWQSDPLTFKTEKDISHPFPTVDSHGDTSWVIDGMQRLSTLYGAFHWSQDWSQELNHLNVYFNLDTGTFFNASSPTNRNEDLSRCISLSGLFTSKKIISDHQRFLNLPDADDLIQKSLDLQSTFQEYLIPTVTLENYPVNEVVLVFERINSTGSRLNVNQFMRAITWSADFDLEYEIQKSVADNELEYFGIKNETFTKALALIHLNSVSPESVTSLRNLDHEELKRLIQQAGRIFRSVKYYCHETFKIFNSRFIPYEGQILFIFKLLMDERSNELYDRAKSWIWRTSFSESLRGKPDDYIQRQLNSLDRAISGNLEEIDEQFTLSAEKLQERRFNFGSALSSSVSMLFAQSEARDILFGEIIEPAEYLSGHNSAWFTPILELENIPFINNRKLTSPRVMANLVLVNPKYSFDYESLNLPYALNNSSEAILSSQFLDRYCIELIDRGNYEEFLSRRSVLMLDFAANISEYNYK